MGVVAYIICAILFGIYAAYRTESDGGGIFNIALSFVVNAIFFPISFGYALIFKKF
jgi:hypothetical protein